MVAPALAVVEYHLVSYRRIWRGSVLSSFVLPVLTMLGFGVGVGAYVEGGVAGVAYLDWVVPGLVASTALQVAFGDATWPVFGGFEWSRIYFAQVAAPLRVADVLGGHLVFVVLRAVSSTAAFLAVAAAFGALHSGWALAVLPLAALLALAAAAPVFGFSASVSSDSFLALLMRFVLVPMSLFSGVFFPVEALPAVLRALAWGLPLWHGVELARAACLGTPAAWPWEAHVMVLAAWAGVGWVVAHARFRRRLAV
jgi:lipooligosaccharide transport system permease protein